MFKLYKRNNGCNCYINQLYCLFFFQNCVEVGQSLNTVVDLVQGRDIEGQDPDIEGQGREKGVDPGV